MKTSPHYHIRIDFKIPSVNSWELLFQSDTSYTEKSLSFPPRIGLGKIYILRLSNGFEYGELWVDHFETPVELRILLNSRGMLLPFFISRKTPYYAGLSHTDPFSTKAKVIFLSAKAYHHSVLFIPENEMCCLPAEFVSTPSEILSETLFPCMTTPFIRLLLGKLHNCPLEGTLKSLYLKGVALELIAIRFNQIRNSRNPNRRRTILNSRDKEKLFEAKRILETQIDNPPDLCSIAQKIGLNCTKLKQGFKRQYGCTVFGYLLHLRMERALELLTRTDMNVSEVGWALGYKNTSSFSFTFKKTFGFAPSTYKK